MTNEMKFLNLFIDAESKYEISFISNCNDFRSGFWNEYFITHRTLVFKYNLRS